METQSTTDQTMSHSDRSITHDTSLLIIITHLIKGSDPFAWKKIYLNLPLIAASLYGGILYRIQLATFKRA